VYLLEPSSHREGLESRGFVDQGNMPPRIISLDDNDATLAARAAALQEAGYVVLSASGTDETLCLLANERDFDLVILGPVFPKAVTEWLASVLYRTSGAPVVVVFSGEANHNIRADAYVNAAEGVDALVRTAYTVLHQTKPATGAS